MSEFIHNFRTASGPIEVDPALKIEVAARDDDPLKMSTVQNFMRGFDPLVTQVEISATRVSNKHRSTSEPELIFTGKYNPQALASIHSLKVATDAYLHLIDEFAVPASNAILIIRISNNLPSINSAGALEFVQGLLKYTHYRGLRIFLASHLTDLAGTLVNSSNRFLDVTGIHMTVFSKNANVEVLGGKEYLAALPDRDLLTSLYGRMTPEQQMLTYLKFSFPDTNMIQSLVVNMAQIMSQTDVGTESINT